jgi:hypothetical protein
VAERPIGRKLLVGLEILADLGILAGREMAGKARTPRKPARLAWKSRLTWKSARLAWKCLLAGISLLGWISRLACKAGRRASGGGLA